MTIIKQAGKHQPPAARKQTKILTKHGHSRQDDYYWLNERENPEVIAYLEAENNYTQAVLRQTESFQNELFEEIKGRIKPDDSSPPYLQNGYEYYTRYEAGREYPIYCRCKAENAADEEIILDVNLLAEGYEYCHVADFEISPDNRYMTYSIDTVSRRQYTLKIKDLNTGETLPDTIPDTDGHMAWANDNKTIFYTQKNPTTLRPERVFRHQLGAEPAQDKEMLHESNEAYWLHTYRCKSGAYIFIASESTLTTEYRLLSTDDPEGDFRVFQVRQRGLEYHVEHGGDCFYVHTNLEAENFRLMTCPIDKTDRANWQEFMAYNPAVLMENVEVFQNYIVVEERQDALSHLHIIARNGQQDYRLPFEEAVYVCWVGHNPEYESEKLRYHYSSLTTPQSIFLFDMQSRQQELLKRDQVLGAFSPDNYCSERLWATADDGTRIPISLVYHKDSLRKAKAPLLQYGYGSYGLTIDPVFRSERLTLLDRGFIFAIAHIRGGQALGRSWYENGKLLKKRNTFTDFIACSKYLIKENYTTADRLFAMGGSAGGLLMGAVVNLQPDLYKGVIAAVPFVDVLTTMLDDSIPLTTGEFDEWGNPNDETYYNYMLSYSPYDNVKAQAYPAMLVTTGLHDSQVQYWEPAKWVAKLRDLKTNAMPLLLDTDMSVGHGGASGRYERHKLTAKEYAFVLSLADC